MGTGAKSSSAPSNRSASCSACSALARAAACSDCRLRVTAWTRKLTTRPSSAPAITRPPNDEASIQARLRMRASTSSLLIRAITDQGVPGTGAEAASTGWPSSSTVSNAPSPRCDGAEATTNRCRPRGGRSSMALNRPASVEVSRHTAVLLAIGQSRNIGKSEVAAATRNTRNPAGARGASTGIGATTSTCKSPPPSR